MSDSDIYLRGLIRDVPDFPRVGIVFKDIMPLLADPAGRQQCSRRMFELVEGETGFRFNIVLAIASRGISFATPLADSLRLPLVLARKPGKLPGEVVSVEYSLEYGGGSLEISKGLIKRGDCVLIVDDLLATGGSADAAKRLVQMEGGEVVATLFAIELTDLKGVEKLNGTPVLSVLKY